MATTTKALDPSAVTVTFAFKPAPLLNQQSDFRITFTNKSTQAVTITRVVVDVGGGAMPTFNLAGSLPEGTLVDQDPLGTFVITWEGTLSVPKGAARTLELQGGFTGARAGSITFPSVAVTSSPQIMPVSRPGPTISVK